MASERDHNKLAMSWEEWGKLDGMSLAELVRSGSVTSKQLAHQAARAIEIINPKINAVLEVFDDVVEDPYKDGMSKEGPFHGVPLLVKDIGPAMRGRLQEKGSLLLKGIRANQDSPLIENLRAAGFNLIGRAATPPFAWAAVTESFIHGITRNPWNLDYTPGGSSGGSAAAVAAGMVPIATGSDGGGSIRDPANFCGLIGLKTTRGRVPLSGANEFASPHVCDGVLTRTVRDTALALDYISRHKLGDTFMPIPKPERPYLQEIARDPGKLRIAASTGKWGCKRDVHREDIACTWRVAGVLESLGHVVEEVADDAICDWKTMWRCARVNLVLSLSRKSKDISASTSVPIDRETVEPAMLYWINKAQKPSDFDMLDLQKDNGVITRRIGQLFENYDLLLCPVNADHLKKAGPGSGYSPLEKLENEEQAIAWIDRGIEDARYTIPANQTGIPAIAIPAGPQAMGMPIGFQLNAPWLREDRLLQMGAQLERTKPDWFDQIPPVHTSRL